MIHLTVRKHPFLVARARFRVTPIAIVAGALLMHVSAVHAGNPEATCQRGRYVAAARYTACHQKTLGKHFGGFRCYSSEGFQEQISKCRVLYTAAWTKLQAKASGTGATCDNARFQDNGDGTVTDRLTGLQWEQKTTDGSVHDTGNVYTWSEGTTTAADGTTYTSFLATLNSAGCFANHCDWRLPAISELQTILTEPYPCTTSPCIDQTIFGPTPTVGDWASTTYLGNPGEAWSVAFQTGNVFNLTKNAGFYYVRAVRAGL